MPRVRQFECAAPLDHPRPPSAHDAHSASLVPDWARRKTCNICNAAKDGMMQVKGTEPGTSRVGVGGGFRELDEQEEARRKRRAEDERHEKESRKAEKRKCAYCHRCACIC